MNGKRILRFATMLFILTVCCVACAGCFHIFGNSHKHDYYMIDIIPPTCSSTGYTLHICSCGESYADNHTPMTEHTPVTDAAVDASCTKTGLTEGSHCNVCGKVLIEQTVIDKTEHTPVMVVPAQEPTCLSYGQTGRAHCGECNAILWYNDAIDRLEHDYQNDICTLCNNYRPTEGLTYTLNPDGLTYALTDASNVSGVVHVAALYDGKRVTAIGDSAFLRNTAVTCITLPEGIEKIGTHAFNGCTALHDLVLPDSVQEIADYAFSYCNISRMHIPQNVSKIGKGIFRACDALTSITTTDNSVYHVSNNCLIQTRTKTIVAGCGASVIPDDGSVTAIGESAFDDCNTLTSVVIPQTITTLGKCAFTQSGLVAIEIPASIEILGESAFYYCPDLENVTLHEGLKTIEKNAFAACAKISHIDFPSSVQTIGEGAFEKCSFASLVIPNTVNNIGKGALGGCTSLENLTVPFVGGKTNISSESSVKLFGYIFGNYSYKGCVEVKQAYGSLYYKNSTFYIPESLKNVTVTGGKIDYGAFQNCTMIESITLPEGVDAIDAYAFAGCAFTSFTLPDSVKTIGASAFSGCTFTSFTVPDSVKTIGASAFSGCLSLKSIVLPDGLEKIETSAFASTPLEEAAVPALAISALPHSNLVKLYVTSGNSISSNRMSNSQTLEYVELADSIGEICKGAFGYCSALTSVKLPASLTAIPESAFEQCKVLSDIEIGHNVVSIGDNAFKGCALLDINVPDSITEMGDYAFDKTAYANNSAHWQGGLLYAGRHVIASNVAQDGTCVICNGTLSVTARVFENSPLTSITIPASLRKFGSFAFRDCNSLSSVYFLSNADDWSQIKFVSKNANPLAFATDFYINGVLPTTLTLSDAVTSICDYAFINCKFTEVILPDSVQTIGWYAFENCSATRLVGNGLTEIDMYAFANCTQLTDITLGNTLKRIGTCAFRNCSSLKEIVIPASVTVIGASAFAGCGALESMTLPFVGNDVNATEASQSTLFGILFGTTDFEGARGVKQNYGSGLNDYIVYYIPTSITHVTVTGGKIWYGAFNNCFFLKQVKITGTVDSIGVSAFDNCFGMERVEIGANVTYIGKRAFYSCSNLKTAYFEITSGWTCYEYSNTTSGSKKPPMGNAGLIAEALQKTHWNYIWRRE